MYPVVLTTPSSTTTDDNYVTVLVYFTSKMCVSFKNRWVNCTTDRSVSTDTVASTSDVTGNTEKLLSVHRLLDSTLLKYTLDILT